MWFCEACPSAVLSLMVQHSSWLLWFFSDSSLNVAILVFLASLLFAFVLIMLSLNPNVMMLMAIAWRFLSTNFTCHHWRFFVFNTVPIIYITSLFIFVIYSTLIYSFLSSSTQHLVLTSWFLFWLSYLFTYILKFPICYLPFC